VSREYSIVSIDGMVLAVKGCEGHVYRLTSLAVSTSYDDFWSVSLTRVFRSVGIPSEFRYSLGKWSIET